MSAAAAGGRNRPDAGEGRGVADVPDCLTLGRDRNLHGRERRPWTRRALLTVLGVLLLLGLLDAFGQRPDTARASGPDATLELYAPARLRSGLFFMARVRVDARADIDHATIVLDPGWLESITLNTIEPAPINESSRDGRIALDFGHLGAGASLLVFLQLQVNPTNVGRREQDVELYDGVRPLARIDRVVTISP